MLDLWEFVETERSEKEQERKHGGWETAWLLFWWRNK